RDEFGAEHGRLYGHRDMMNTTVEVIAVRLIGRAPFPRSHRMRPATIPVRSGGSRRATFGPPWWTVETPTLARAALAKPTRGPLLVDEYDSTLVIPPDMTARLDDENNVVMEFCE